MKLIKRIRESLGLTQTDLAKRLRVTRPAFNMYENGVREMPLPVLLRLRRLGKVPASKFIKWLEDDVL